MLKRRDRSRDVSNVVTGNAKGPTMQGDVGRYQEIQGETGNAKRARARVRGLRSSSVAYRYVEAAQEFLGAHRAALAEDVAVKLTQRAGRRARASRK